MSETLLLTYEPDGEASRLDSWLAANVAGLSRSRIQSLMDSGAVTSGGAVLGPRSKLAPGTTIEINLPPPTPPEPRPQDIPLDIIFEDDSVIAVNKPAGMVVHPAPGHDDSTFVNALLFHCGESLKGIGGVRRPGIVHRLDMDTTGVLIAAKDEPSLNNLAAQFQAHSTAKVYVALVHGKIERESGKIASTIGRHPTDRKKMAFNPPSGGKNAVTCWKVMRRFERATLLEVRIETGRTHQIRVHLSHEGMPIAGDRTYGNRQLDSLLPMVPSRQMLHAARFSFNHPKTGERITLEAPLPADFQELLERLQPNPLKNMRPSNH